MYAMVVRKIRFIMVRILGKASVSWRTKTTLIREVICEIAEQPKWNVDRQTDDFSALFWLLRFQPDHFSDSS